MLDLRENTADSTSTKGLLLPRVALSSTTAYTPMSAHVKGMTVYNIATVSDVSPGFYYNNGTKWVRMADAAALANYWTIIGNSGTNPATNFIGTTDNADLIFKRNNVQAGWINAPRFNTAFGVYSLPTTSTGIGNTSIGYNTLTANSTGNNNTAVGLSALAVNTGGFSNTAVGNYAAEKNNIGIQNVAIGVSALTSNVSGGHNVAIGTAAGLYVTGSSNTLLGDYAGSTLTSGSNNIALGVSQELASNIGSNQLNIGGAIFGTGLSGSVFAPAGKIGIGVVAPKKALHVNAQNDSLRIDNLPGTGALLGMDAVNNVYKINGATISTSSMILNAQGGDNLTYLIHFINNTYIILNLNEVTDTDNGYDPSTGKYTVQKAGLYNVNYKITLHNNPGANSVFDGTSGMFYCTLTLDKGGAGTSLVTIHQSQTVVQRGAYVAAGNTQYAVPFSTLIFLNVGDVIYPSFKTYSTGSMNGATNSIIIPRAASYFSIYRVL